MPSPVAAQRLKGKKPFVSLDTPKPPRAFEAALVLCAGGLHGARTDRLPQGLALLVVHAVFVAIAIPDFTIQDLVGLNRIGGLFRTQLAQRLPDIRRSVPPAFEMPDQRRHPLLGLGIVFSEGGAGNRSMRKVCVCCCLGQND